MACWSCIIRHSANAKAKAFSNRWKDVVSVLLYSTVLSALRCVALHCSLSLVSSLLQVELTISSAYDMSRELENRVCVFVSGYL